MHANSDALELRIPKAVGQAHADGLKSAMFTFYRMIFFINDLSIAGHLFMTTAMNSTSS